MSDKKQQLNILKEIFEESFEAKEAGKRQSSTLYEITCIEGVEIPKGVKVLVNFDDAAKVRMAVVPFYGGGYTKEEDDRRFMGNLNVFITKGKKTLDNIHQPFDGEKFEKRENCYSLKKILECCK